MSVFILQTHLNQSDSNRIACHISLSAHAHTYNPKITIRFFLNIIRQWKKYSINVTTSYMENLCNGCGAGHANKVAGIVKIAQIKNHQDSKESGTIQEPLSLFSCLQPSTPRREFSSIQRVNLAFVVCFLKVLYVVLRPRHPGFFFAMRSYHTLKALIMAWMWNSVNWDALFRWVLLRIEIQIHVACVCTDLS